MGIKKENRIRVAVFGINDGIWNVLYNGIDWQHVQIVCFIDNDLKKVGLKFNHIPIISAKQIDDNDLDYIIIAAIRSYVNIKEQLCEYGISSKKIMPLLFSGMQMYNIDFSGIDLQCFEHIFTKDISVYTDYKKEISEIKDMRNQYDELLSLPKNENVWCKKSTLIAHACGGIINGRKLMYTNSREALEYSLQRGYKLIECDAFGIENGRILMAHRGTDILLSKEEKYTLLYWNDIAEQLINYPDVSVLVDIKWIEHEDYYEIVDLIDQSANNKLIKDQIILEAYDEETIRYTRQKGYECFYTQYRNPDWNYFVKTAILCLKYGVNAVGFGVGLMLQKNCIANIHIFKEKNIHVFCFSTDSIDEYVSLLDGGVDGVFTNYLEYI